MKYTFRSTDTEFRGDKIMKEAARKGVVEISRDGETLVLCTEKYHSRLQQARSPYLDLFTGHCGCSFGPAIEAGTLKAAHHQSGGFPYYVPSKPGVPSLAEIHADLLARESIKRVTEVFIPE